MDHCARPSDAAPARRVTSPTCARARAAQRSKVAPGFDRRRRAVLVSATAVHAYPRRLTAALRNRRCARAPRRRGHTPTTAATIAPPASTTSSSSTRRTTASTTCTAAGRASTGSPRRSGAHARSPRTGTPYTCLLQVDVNLTSPPLPRRVHRQHHGDRLQPATSPTRRSRSTTTSRRRTTCPAPGVSAPNGEPERSKDCRAAARATSSTATTRSSTSSTADGRTATSTGSDAVGLTWATTTRAACRSTVPAPPQPPALRDRRPVLPGAPSAARSSTTSG